MGFYSNYLFPRVMNAVMSNKLMTEERKKVLSSVSGEILEIGFGTGLNLPHYPDYVRKITVIDPNAGMKTLAERQIRASRIEVESHTLAGEHLPMRDHAFDTVVCTWTLCSIADVEQALREVRRVLRPGGRFLFVEHGLSDKRAVQKWQNRLNPIQRALGDGCNLNRPMDRLIESQGLTLASIDRFDLPKTPKFVGHLYRGIATKEQES